jgi:hypothetical protein
MRGFLLREHVLVEAVGAALQGLRQAAVSWSSKGLL